MGYWCHCRCGHGSWLWYLVFLLGLLGSNGGLISGYRGGSVSDLWCWVGCAMDCGMVKFQQWRDKDERDGDKILIFFFCNCTTVQFTVAQLQKLRNTWFCIP